MNRLPALLCLVAAGALADGWTPPPIPLVNGSAQAGSYTTTGQGCVLSDASGPIATISCTLQVPGVVVTSGHNLTTPTNTYLQLDGTADGNNAPAYGVANLTGSSALVVRAGGNNYLFTAGGLALPSGATLHLSSAVNSIDNNSNVSTVGISSGATTAYAADKFSFTSAATVSPAMSGQYMSFYGASSQRVYVWNNQGLPALYSTAPRRQGSYQVNLTADTTFAAIGLPAPSVIACSGTCTPAADTASDSAYQMIKYPTDGTVNHCCGYGGPFTVAISPTYLPLWYKVLHTDSANITNTRIYAGMPKSDLSLVTTLAGANAINGCFFRYDTGIGDTDWMAESSDGTTASASDTSIALAAATTYVMLIDNSVSGECDFYVNGVKKVAKSTNITTTNTALGLQASITNITSGAVRNLSLSKTILQEN